MIRLCARSAAIFCLAFAAFQIALAAGAPFGEMAWGGSSAVLPTKLRLASLGAAVFLIAAAGALEVRAGDWGRTLPPLPFRVIAGVLALQLALNTAANLAAKSGAEQYGMGAASALGCLLCLGAVGLRRRA